MYAVLPVRYLWPVVLGETVTEVTTTWRAHASAVTGVVVRGGWRLCGVCRDGSLRWLGWCCVEMRVRACWQGRLCVAFFCYSLYYSIGVVLNLIYSFIIVDVCIHDTAFTR